MRAEQLTDPICYHAEGPVWSPDWEGVRWVDMLAGDVLQLDRHQAVARRHIGPIACVVRPRRDGGWLAVGEHTVGVSESCEVSAPLTPVATLLDDPQVRLNEGGCDPWGNLIVGSMAYDQRDGGARLYRLTPAGEVSVVFDQVSISNGVDWLPDGSRALYVDTPTDRIDVADAHPERGLVNRRPFVDLADADGHPDGLTVDSAGGAWVAMNGGGCVRHYTANGELDALIEVGARQITAVTLGGEDLRTLYITSSRENLPDGEDPLAGSLWTARADVPGTLPGTFGG